MDSSSEDAVPRGHHPWISAPPDYSSTPARSRQQQSSSTTLPYRLLDYEDDDDSYDGSSALNVNVASDSFIAGVGSPLPSEQGESALPPDWVDYYREPQHKHGEPQRQQPPGHPSTSATRGEEEGGEGGTEQAFVNVSDVSTAGAGQHGPLQHGGERYDDDGHGGNGYQGGGNGLGGYVDQHGPPYVAYGVYGGPHGSGTGNAAIQHEEVWYVQQAPAGVDTMGAEYDAEYRQTDDHADVDCSRGVSVTVEQIDGVSVNVISAEPDADLWLSDRVEQEAGDEAACILMGRRRKAKPPEAQFKNLAAATHGYASRCMRWFTGGGWKRGAAYRLRDRMPRLKTRSVAMQIGALPQPYGSAVRHGHAFFRDEYAKLPTEMQINTIAAAIDTAYKAQAATKRYQTRKAAKQNDAAEAAKQNGGAGAPDGENTAAAPYEDREFDAD